MQKKALILTLLILMLTACGEYQKILKSTDPDFKYNAAIEYFNRGEYVKAQTLLDDVTSYYRGTERSEDVLIYLARCYMGQKVYDSAAEYYEAYTRSYPKGRYNMEARFMVAHAYYMDSPDARLDQKTTRTAIQFFTQFIEMFPESSYAEQAYSERQEMFDKLAYKELLSARLYYNLGTYLGNNYLSCETVSKNALKTYPASPYTEEFNWLVFAAKYQQMVNSATYLLEERGRVLFVHYRVPRLEACSSGQTMVQANTQGPQSRGRLKNIGSYGSPKQSLYSFTPDSFTPKK